MNQKKQKALISSLLDVASFSSSALPRIYMNPDEFSLFELSWENGSMSLLEPATSEKDVYRFNGMDILRHLDVKPGWFAFERNYAAKALIARWQAGYATPVWTSIELDGDHELRTRRREMLLLQFWKEESEE